MADSGEGEQDAGKQEGKDGEGKEGRKRGGRRGKRATGKAVEECEEWDIAAAAAVLAASGSLASPPTASAKKKRGVSIAVSPSSDAPVPSTKGTDGSIWSEFRCVEY